MSGGDGAPGWTFEAAGLDFTRFHASNAALVMQYNYDASLGGRQASYPTMSWGGNYARPANGIMWTLFFAGNDFAPALKVGGVGIQSFLQDHYLGSMHALASHIGHLDNVLGFDTLNEPGTGYIGKAMDEPLVRGQGALWTPLEGLAVASGLTRNLPDFVLGQGVAGTTQVNSDGVSIWLPGRLDPFREAGAWDISEDGEPIAISKDYFQARDGRVVDHERDYMLPFFNRVADAIRSVRDDWLVFAELDPFDVARGHGFPDGMPVRSINASHWYDITSLVTKRFSTDQMVHVMTGEVREGAQAIEDAYVRELSVLASAGANLNGGAPTLIGECGIQFDMNDAKAYQAWAAGDRDPAIWADQTSALDLMYNAFDRLLLSSTQWNYTVSNSNNPMIGDGWNQEDLSVWSADQMIPGEPSSGGRAVEGFSRPYVQAAQGTIISQRFNRCSGAFEAVIMVDAGISAPTEIYVPTWQYPDGYAVHLSDGAEARQDGQMLHISSSALELCVRIERENVGKQNA